MAHPDKFTAAIRLAGLESPLGKFIEQGKDGNYTVKYDTRKYPSFDLQKYLPLFSLFDNLTYLEIKNSDNPSYQYITELTSLKTLILENFKTPVVSDISDLSHLTTLQVTKSRLRSLPDEITKLTNLEQLWLQENGLTTLPSDIGTLKNLRTLFLQGNSLQSLPESLAELHNLRIIILDRNKFSSFPDVLLELENLEGIGLKRNNIGSIPDEISRLENLITLNLSYTAIDYLPSSINHFWTEKTPLEADSLGFRKGNDF